MRIPTLMIGAFGIVAAAASPVDAADVESLPSGKGANGAYAERCLKDLYAFDEKLAKVGFGVLAPGGYVSPPSGYYAWGVEGTPRQKIRSLREAAYVYAKSGDEQACQMVLASMQEAFEEHQEFLGPAADEPEVRRKWRRAHISRAEPVTQMDHLMRADVLIGSELRNFQDEKLGEIEDVVMNPQEQRIIYVLASHGGFFGFGERLVAIPWSDLRATQDHELYVLDVPDDAMRNAPKVDRSNFRSTADSAWQDSLSAYWEKAKEP